MNLLKNIEQIPLFRSWDIFFSEKNICCIAMKEDLDKLELLINEYPTLKIRLLLVPDIPDNAPEQLILKTPKGTSIIPISSNIQAVTAVPRWNKVILCRPDSIGASVAAMLCRYLAMCGTHNVHLYAGHSQKFGIQTPLPNFYDQHAAKLQEVYGLLADDASRAVYTGRTRALMTGNAGYLPLSPHQEYYHPCVQPAPGDIMLDGGVSDMVGAQIQFAQSVGSTGHIFGFEPIPDMAAIAKRNLKDFPQYHLQTAGLGEASGQVHFTCLRDSSHIAESPAHENSVLCQMTTIDDFVQKHHLGRVDCIKLDVEGAEMLALTGGRKTILKHRPKLIICLYHKSSDMIDIPLFIHDLVPEYTIYVSHSSCIFTDTILYAHNTN